jgi:hypothetical protein
MRPNLQSNIFGLKVRTRGSQPSICVPTFSLFTITTALRDGSVTDVHGPASPPRWRCRRLRRRSGFVMQDSTGSSDLAISVVMESTSPTEQSTYFL